MNRPGATSVPPGAAISAPLLDAGDPTLFPKLTEAQVELLASHGEVRPTSVGQALFRQGDAAYDVMVVLGEECPSSSEAAKRNASSSARAPAI